MYPDWIVNKSAKNKHGIINRLYTYFNHLAIVKANPRTADYCLQNTLDNAVTEFEESAEFHVVLLADEFDNKYSSYFSSFKKVQSRSEFESEVKERIYGVDIVVLLYPDSIGQGFEQIEKIVTREKKKLYALNGRKRFFELTPDILKSLKIRRIFEKYFALEIITSFLFPFFSIPYFVYEFCTRKLYQRTFRKSLAYDSRQSVLTEEIEDTSVINQIKTYWSSRPQTYGAEDGKPVYRDEDGTMVSVELGDNEFFEKVDSTFYKWNKPLHREINGEIIPFGKIFNYEDYKDKNVLEIGCGMGTMAMNWAQRGALVSAVDLNPVAVEQTKKRFAMKNIPGNIKQVDARKLPFNENYFNYVYSWGVLHHSPNIKKSMKEIHRVLAPGGRVGLMLYHRNSLLFRYMVEYTEGFLHFENHFLSQVELASRYGDGAREEGNPYTFPVTKKEILQEIMPGFKNVRFKLFGTELEGILFFLCLRYNKYIPLPLIKSYARRFGWSMWIEAEK